MSWGGLFKKVFYSPWLLAALPAIVIMTLLSPVGLRYTLEVEERGMSYNKDVYADLNSDSITEIIRMGKGDPYYHILIFDNNQRIYDQWNLKDTLDPGLSEFFFGNCDNDLFSEIYIFSYRDDSVFLNVNEFFDPQGIKYDGAFITKVGIVNNTNTSSVFPAGFYDVNADGNKELYFTIATGFGLEPRLVYYFDIISKKVKAGQFTGVNCQLTKSFDADGDKKPEIFGLISANGNYKVPTPYSDQSTWFMVFDEELNMEFPPAEFPGLTNKLEINSYSGSDFKGYVLNHNTNTADTAVMEPRIMVFSVDGKKEKELIYKDLGFNMNVLLNILPGKHGDRIFLLEKDLIELDENLDIIKKIKSPLNPGYYAFLEDIDMNGEKEFFLYSENEEKVVVVNPSFQIMSETKLKALGYNLRFSHMLSGTGERKLFLTSTENAWFIEMRRNSFYLSRYLEYPGVYLLLVLFISGINKINTYQVQQRESLKQRLLTLQLQGIKSQLDPHFTFNALNSIASLIYLEDRQTAYDYMNKFTVLLRSMLNDADRIYRSLGEEVEFVTTYLELEKLRFGNKFDFRIELSDEVSQKEQVPKLVLQTFAENAIKHGLMPCADGGILKIIVKREGDYLKLSIEDNGVGREKSAGRSTSTGKGLKLTSEFYDILNQRNKKAIKHYLTDLYTETGVPAGTRVDVWVPLSE
jgi:two-component sensor histidine kinase